MRRVNLAVSVMLMIFASLVSDASSSDRWQPNIPDNAVRDMESGRNLRRQGKFKESYARFNRAISVAPEYFLAHYNLGLAYADANELDKAIDSLETAKSIREKFNIKDATIYNSLGYTYLLAGKYENAEKSFFDCKKNESLLSTTSKQKLYNNMGVLYQFWGKFDKSENAYKTAKEKYESNKAGNNLVSLNNTRKVVEKSRNSAAK
ncbi:MAG: tetratricopeptide repeat protein [Nitrospirae bacterium]|nr:tetratricopeptide repeat protein [Nitrospirota bacterium]